MESAVFSFLSTIRTRWPARCSHSLRPPIALAKWVSAGGEPAAFVREHRAGIVVSPGDGPGLVEALRTLCADPVLRQQLGANGRKAAERLFDKADIDTAFIDYLEHNHRIAPADGGVPRPVPSRPA